MAVAKQGALSKAFNWEKDKALSRQGLGFNGSYRIEQSCCEYLWNIANKIVSFGTHLTRPSGHHLDLY